MKDLTILLEDKPGTLAEVAETLAKAGINIEGGCGYPAIGRGIFHILVEDEEAATNALESAGITVSEKTDVIVMAVENEPGKLGIIMRKIADAGINANIFYIASNNRIVLSVDNFEKANSILIG